jgi:RimJ/RimL family protein N-acetyltransferase
VVIVADRRGDLAGYVELVGGKFRRNRSTTHVVIGVLAEASGKGVGRGLLEEAKRWAAARGLRRMELNVMAHNHRAIALYERAGFVHEGRRVECLLIDGQFLDELCMAMILAGPLSVRDPARAVIRPSRTASPPARLPPSTPLHAASSALRSRVS